MRCHWRAWRMVEQPQSLASRAPVAVNLHPSLLTFPSLPPVEGRATAAAQTIRRLNWEDRREGGPFSLARSTPHPTPPSEGRGGEGRGGRRCAAARRHLLRSFHLRRSSGMFGDMAATDSSMAMAMAIYPLQGQGPTTTTTATSSSSSYNAHHMLSFMGHSHSSPDPTLMPPRPPTPAATSNATLLLPPPPPNPSSLPSAPQYKYKFVTCSPADWTTHELAILEEGLIRYAHESTITKYIKVAAMLPTKTIRDVALRCCWTPGKESVRSKPDEYYAGKNMMCLKNKMAASASASIVDIPMPPRNNPFPFSISLHRPSQNSLVSMEAIPILDTATQQLLDENNQLLSQIAANIEILKTEGNLDLFLRTNNNIRAISERMRETHGIMDQMPPLPVHVNEEHLSSLAHLLRGARLT